MSKTPVSIIQEYCARNGMAPQYDLIQNGVGTHNPIFGYRLTINEVITYGEGKSKKEAKHEAAKIAITLIPECHSTSSCVSAVKSEPMECIASPYQGVLKENAIGELTTICVYNKLPAPEYNLIGEEGPAHARSFTYECHVAKLVTTAVSRTKKQAKHLSAKLMLKRLIEMLGDTLELNPPEANEESKKMEDNINQRAKEAYFSTKSVKLNENFDLYISEYHTADLTPIFGDNPVSLLKLSNYNESNEGFLVDPLKFLQDLMVDADVNYRIKEFPSVSQTTHIFICELDSSPPVVHFGVHKNKEVAEKIVAHKLLCHLKLFCYGITKQIPS